MARVLCPTQWTSLRTTPEATCTAHLASFVGFGFPSHRSILSDRLDGTALRKVEAGVKTHKPRVSRGTEILVRKHPELQAPFEERLAFTEAKKRERERLRCAARVCVPLCFGAIVLSSLRSSQSCDKFSGLAIDVDMVRYVLRIKYGVTCVRSMSIFCGPERSLPVLHMKALWQVAKYTACGSGQSTLFKCHTWADICALCSADARRANTSFR